MKIVAENGSLINLEQAISVAVVENDANNGERTWLVLARFVYGVNEIIFSGTQKQCDMALVCIKNQHLFRTIDWKVFKR